MANHPRMVKKNAILFTWIKMAHPIFILVKWLEWLDPFSFWQNGQNDRTHSHL
jgi:hypothetical protein